MSKSSAAPIPYDPHVAARRARALALIDEMMTRLADGLDDDSEEGEKRAKRLQSGIVGLQKLISTLNALPNLSAEKEVVSVPAEESVLNTEEKKIFTAWLAEQAQAEAPASGMMPHDMPVSPPAPASIPPPLNEA